MKFLRWQGSPVIFFEPNVPVTRKCEQFVFDEKLASQGPVHAKPGESAASIKSPVIISGLSVSYPVTVLPRLAYHSVGLFPGWWTSKCPPVPTRRHLYPPLPHSLSLPWLAEHAYVTYNFSFWATKVKTDQSLRRQTSALERTDVEPSAPKFASKSCLFPFIPAVRIFPN